MRLLPAALAALALAFPVAHARAPRAAPQPVAPDTALVRLLAAAAVDAATPPRARLVTTGAPFPWRITVPDTLAPTWRALQATLVTALNARPLAPSDTVHAFLSLGDVRRAHDELRATLGVGLAWRCPNGAWMRSSAGYRLQARHVAGTWRRERLEVEVIADPAPCAALSPPR